MIQSVIIRKLNKKKYWIKNLIFISIVIFLVIVLFFELISTMIAKKDKDINTKELSWNVKSYIIGEDITLEWKIYSWENSDYYDIILKSDIDYWLRSKDFDLKKFIWEYTEIKGKTYSFYKDLPIIDVTTIKIPNKNIIVEKNNYTFTKYLIRFKFNKQNELKADLSEDDSIEITYDWQPVATIEIFLCNKINKVQDCESLAMNYKYSNKDFFDSYWWYKFYRYDEKAWITFNDDMFGYIFKNIDDETMLDLSSTIEIINKEFVLTNKKTVILDECQTNWESTNQIDDSKLEPKKERLLSLTIQGETNKKRRSTCEITFDLRNSRKPEKISLEFK